MKLEEIKEYFGSTYKFEKQTGMSLGNMNNWEKNGYVTTKAQLFLEILTDGELKASIEDEKKAYEKLKGDCHGNNAVG